MSWGEERSGNEHKEAVDASVREVDKAMAFLTKAVHPALTTSQSLLELAQADVRIQMARAHMHRADQLARRT